MWGLLNCHPERDVFRARDLLLPGDSPTPVESESASSLGELSSLARALPDT